MSTKEFNPNKCSCNKEPKLNYDYDPTIFWGQEPSPKEVTAGKFAIQGIPVKDLSKMVDTLVSAGIKNFTVIQMKVNEWDIYYDE